MTVYAPQLINNESILEYMGVTTNNVRQDAYNHWSRFVDFCKKNSGKHWKNDIRPKLRSWIGVDFRYIDDYLSSCLAWGIIELKDDILIFKGIHDAVVASEPESFMEYAKKQQNKSEKMKIMPQQINIENIHDLAIWERRTHLLKIMS